MILYAMFARMDKPESEYIRLLDELKVSNELTATIQKFTQLIADEDMSIALDIQKALREPEGLTKMAKLAELRIRAKQISRIRKKVRKLLSDLVNIMVIASIKPSNN